MLVEILTDTWINSDYIVSVIIDDMDRFPVLIRMDAPDNAGEALTYRTTPQAWDHIRIQLKLYSRLTKPSVVETQSALPGAAEALKPSATPMIEWVRVEIVERDSFYSKTSDSRRAMWRLITDDGRTANLFDHADMLRDSKTMLRDADYLGIFQGMTEGQHDTWTVSPIEVELQPDGSFWRVKQIKPRPDGAAPDLDEDAGAFADPVEDDDLDEMFPAIPTDLQELVALVRRGNFVILDTETTGLGATAEICSIAIIDDTGRLLLDTLVKPVHGIPADATKIHGITNDTVQDAGGWLNLNERVWDLLYGRDVIVYNADYDFRLLVQTEKACEPFALSDWSTISRVCAMNAYAEHVGDWNEYHDNYRWHKLTDAARAAGFKLPDGMKAHSAAADCMMTLAVCRYLAGDAIDTSGAI